MLTEHCRTTNYFADSQFITHVLRICQDLLCIIADISELVFDHVKDFIFEIIAENKISHFDRLFSKFFDIEEYYADSDADFHRLRIEVAKGWHFQNKVLLKNLINIRALRFLIMNKHKLHRKNISLIHNYLYRLVFPHPPRLNLLFYRQHSQVPYLEAFQNDPIVINHWVFKKTVSLSNTFSEYPNPLNFKFIELSRPEKNFECNLETKTIDLTIEDIDAFLEQVKEKGNRTLDTADFYVKSTDTESEGDGTLRLVVTEGFTIYAEKYFFLRPTTKRLMPNI